MKLFVQNKIGDAPIHSAAWRGHADVVKILLEHGEFLENDYLFSSPDPKGHVELLPSLGVRRRRTSYTFSKIFSSDSTRPMETKLGLDHH